MTTRREQLEPLSSEAFRDVIGHFTSGVTIVTTIERGAPFGTTASAVSSLSLEPPMLLVCMNVASETGQAIRRTGLFAVNVLAEHQHELAARFAGKGGGKFAGVEHELGHTGQPLLSDALATLECRVTERVCAATHVVLLARVEQGSARPGRPLAYYRGRFHALAG